MWQTPRGPWPGDPRPPSASPAGLWNWRVSPRRPPRSPSAPRSWRGARLAIPPCGCALRGSAAPLRCPLFPARPQPEVVVRTGLGATASVGVAVRSALPPRPQDRSCLLGKLMGHLIAEVPPHREGPGLGGPNSPRPSLASVVRSSSCRARNISGDVPLRSCQMGRCGLCSTRSPVPLTCREPAVSSP